MPKSDGDLITELDYNTLQDTVNTIMGTPQGTTDTTATGYNQTLTSSQVAVGSKITEAQWDNLRTDITKAYTHIFGSAPTITNVDDLTIITDTIYNQYETLVSTISTDPNRYTMDNSQDTITTGQTGTLSSGWNGTQRHRVDCTFASENERRAFFNAGGQIRINLVLSYTGSESKTLDWQSMMSDLGTVTFNYKETSSGPGTTSVGNYDLTTSYQSIALELGTNPYGENFIDIKAKQGSTGRIITFDIILAEEDSGDRPVPSPPPPYGPVVDENVKGTVTSTVTIRRPSGSNVAVPAPSITNPPGNTFTT
jgi:hypothetical protein